MSTANKIKQFTAFRQCAINQLAELKAFAERTVLDDQLRIQFKMLYEPIDTICIDFKTHHNNLIALLAIQDDSDLAAEEEIRASFELDCSATRTIYYNLFSREENRQVNRTSEQFVSPRSHIKLPIIEIPKFAGNLKTFKTFIDMYNSLVHHNDALADIEKFNYLTSSLENAPLKLIQCTPMTAENYTIAYNALINRYDNKRLIATAHLQEIDNAPNVTDSKNSQKLRLLLDIFNENLAALQNLKFPVAEWDFVLFYFFSKHLDAETLTRFEFEHGSNNNTIPSYETLKNFVQKQCNALDAIHFSSQNKNQSFVKTKYKNSPQNNLISKPRQSSNFLVTQNKNCCLLCKADHHIYKCSLFQRKTPQERYNFVKQHNLCVNCISAQHTFRNCNSNSVCRECKSRHHTLLHFNRNVSSPVQNESSVNDNENFPQFSGNVIPGTSNSEQVSTLTGVVHSKTSVILSTAEAEVLDARGNYKKIRILLDSGSQATFISEKCVNRLGLSRFNFPLSVSGLGQMQTFTTSGGVTCTLRPIGQQSQKIMMDAIILPTLCAEMPSTYIPKQSWPHITNLKLADPQFNTPSSVDLLLGADIFPHILLDGRLTGKKNEPSAMNTIFGWVLLGKVNYPTSPQINTFFTSLNSLALDNLIKRFWEIEEIPQINSYSPDDALCEKLYSDTHFRNESGRFVVSLPFRDAAPHFDFHDSRSLALRRFLSLERRLLRTPALYKEYADFMQEYLQNKHMEPVQNVPANNNSYYIPHHCVLKPESTTTKLRVVFDASAKLPNCKSLNDTLLTGPKLQQDIVTVLLHFRLHPFVFTADIKQMYRQILITENHRDFQRILWRFSPSEPIQDFRLNTITFGVSSAPFLAIRTLIQLAHDEQRDFPMAYQVIKSNIYVDDIVTGCETLDEARILQNQLIGLLKRGGFELRKWASNHPNLLSHLPDTHLYNKSLSLDMESDSTVKILGLQWHPSSDVFFYHVEPIDRVCTKRTILSELARIFDPLGFLTPLTFFAKHLIQYLWSLGLNWDETPPEDVLKFWSKYKSELSLLCNFQLPRRLLCDNFISCQLHGFCDSSEKGYSAVAFFRVQKSSTEFLTFFVCAKSKVAPLKRISIPRLELCAAVLLSNLLCFISKIYDGKITFSETFAWSDSTIALSWIRSSPHRWKTFVGNRVTHIQDRISPSFWHHVPSSDNPADCASRGLLPSALLDHALWWAGPHWLCKPKSFWPTSSTTIPVESAESLIEERKIALTAFVALESVDLLLNKYSSLLKIKRIIAYIFRFLHNARNPGERKSGAFTIWELNNALFILVKRIQYLSFAESIAHLKKGTLPSKPFRKLNAFLDNEGVLRVGGRLNNSQLSYDQKHPVILPRSSRLTDLIIEDTHKQYLHPGMQTLHFLLTQNFWILSAKRAIRNILSKCYKCWRLNPKPLQPPMGNLPSFRVSQIKVFSHVGIDFGGPFKITLGKTRGAKTFKAYMCIFVCFATKAVHVELVSDLTTEAFLAALRRFIARRGRCSHIYSDCGTNFTGAQKQMSQIMQNAAESETIEWHFNPPSAPHFGGLWEAGIKSFKTHLYRVIGEQILTYEELYTVLVQVESVLNSRPLCPVSSDPNDLSVLTPGHFLTLEPLTSIPDPDYCNLKLNRLTRWQLLQRLHQDFWSRWRSEYLHTLHQRGKWTQPSTPISPGTMVVIKNDLTPPLRWTIGRILEVHPGADNVVRVATVRTAQGIFKRPLVKLCPLPNPQTD